MSRRDDKGIKRINPDRYRELKYFCRQYPVWMKKIYEVEESIGIRGVKYDDMPHARNASSGVEQKVLQLNMLYAKVTKHCLFTARQFIRQQKQQLICWGLKRSVLILMI